MFVEVSLIFIFRRLFLKSVTSLHNYYLKQTSCRFLSIRECLVDGCVLDCNTLHHDCSDRSVIMFTRGM